MEGSLVINFSNYILENIILFSGVFISFLLLFYGAINSSFRFKEVFFLSLFVFIFGCFFGSLGHYLFYYNDIILLKPDNPVLFKVCNLAFLKDHSLVFDDSWEISDHGLIFGFVVAGLVNSFVFRLNFLKVLDSMIFQICFLLCTFRIIDLFKVKNFGVPTEQSYGVIFYKVDYLPRHACMIYELVLLLIVLVVMIYIFSRLYSYIEKTGTYGFLFFLGIFFIYVSKVCVAYLKVQDNIFSFWILDVLKLNVDQFLNIVLLTVSLIFVILRFPKIK